MKTFSEFQEGVAALKLGSKLLPKLMVAAGLLGTLMQTRKRSVFQGNRKSKKNPNKRIAKDTSKTADIAREMGLDLTDPKQRMKANSLVRRNQMKNKKNNPDGIKNIRKEETTAAPTNSVGDGSNVSLPPSYVPGMRKRYAKGGKNSRKPWLDHLKNKYT